MKQRKSGHFARWLLPAAVALGLSACAAPFRADVSRFTAFQAPVGQSFVVVAGDPALSGGLEFQQYARLVEGEMSELGYVSAADPASADLVVSLDYKVGQGREKVVSDYSPGFYDPFYGPGWGYGYRHHRYRLGYHDPFLFGGYGFSGYGGVRSYTVYESGLEMKIDRRVDGERLFEGRAEALSRSNNLTYLVPNLVEAMFTGFPGESGETVRISIAPEKG